MASAWLIVVMGVFMAFNFGIIKWKYENDREADATMDLGFLILLSWWLGDSITGMAMATVASAILSMYLLISPPKINWE